MKSFGPSWPCLGSFSWAKKGYVLETGAVVLEASAEALLHNDLVKSAYLGV